MVIEIMSEIYDKKYFDEQEFIEKDPWNFFTSEYEEKKYKRQLDLIEKHYKNPKNIFEIGCAEGAHTIKLAANFTDAEIIGLDISHKAIERAIKNCQKYKNIKKLIEADIIDCTEQDKLPKNKFDVVVWSESIYYLGARLPLYKIYELLEKLVNTLKNKGILVTANIINQQDAPETPLVRRGIIKCYHTMLSELADAIYNENFKDYKKESEQEYEYSIAVFRK